MLLLLSNLIVSRYGRTWRAVRDDEVAAELAGINLGRARVLAFVVSAACAGRRRRAVRGRHPAGRADRASRSSCRSRCSSRSSSAGWAAWSARCSAARWWSSCAAVTDLGRDAGLTDAQAANIAPLAYGVVLILVMLLAPRGVVGSIRFALPHPQGRAEQIARPQAR